MHSDEAQCCDWSGFAHIGLIFDCLIIACSSICRLCLLRFSFRLYSNRERCSFKCFVEMWVDLCLKKCFQIILLIMFGQSIRIICQSELS